MAEFSTSVTVDGPIEKVFNFLIRPANAVKFSPPDLGIVLIDAPEVLQAGSRIEFKIQTWGQVTNLIHEIMTFIEPTQYVERQIKGPFKAWLHTHLLETNAAGQVVVTDQIEFEPPGGLIGLLVTKKKIIEHLEDGFFYRHDHLRKLLDAEV